jgi:uncharacterized protein (TIGR02246 family)
MSVDTVATGAEVEVRAACEAVLDAWAANDANAFADLHTEDATLVTVEGLYCKGREQIRGVMTMLYAGVFKGSKVFVEYEDVRLMTADTAIVVYWNGILQGGLKKLPPEETRRATTVLVKQDGKWLVSAFQNVFITDLGTEQV